MIVLTGTTGNLGSSILRHMLGLVPPSWIVASVHNRSAQAHEELEKRGVHVRAGDYHDPGSLERASAGSIPCSSGSSDDCPSLSSRG
ncbi:NmrA family NAD(P)-binding protein [Sorangium sp. So ce136]|uniref:hypothetical protein n=1 Tax=Sorangium sp. So ce136 TaxID=3133284 RepID=UPI003F128A3B